MNYKIKSAVYNRIASKVEDGIYTKGENCILTRYCYKGDIKDYPLIERTPEVCSYLMSYGRCRFSDVPKSSRTREFFLDSFTNDDVYDYIKNHITDFDRQFFKDLIATNEYATHFDRNCFAVMPLEYIDEEMCSLAILSSLDWSNDNWFLSAYKRKPEALTADLWKLGARLYSRMSGQENIILNITPEEFKDTEYYKEMCSCNYNCGMELDTNKGQIMDSIPQEVLTLEFLINLLVTDIKNIARFSEIALEVEVVFEKIWQLAVRLDGYLIRNIKLNDERIEFFLSRYDKDSGEYRWGFKDNYKIYMEEKNDSKALTKTQQTTINNIMGTATGILLSGMIYSIEGENPTKAIEDAVDRKEIIRSSFIPIKYKGIVPRELCKEYDSEEYLEMLYKTMGIELIEKYDNLFYRINLPKGWSTDNNGYWNVVKDNEGTIIIEYFYYSKFYDREAYVSVINIPKEETFGWAKKLLPKHNDL